MTDECKNNQKGGMKTPSNSGAAPLSITAPLPGWLRFQHVRTGRTLDFNPAYHEHRLILTHYANNPDWQRIDDNTPETDGSA